VAARQAKHLAELVTTGSATFLSIVCRLTVAWTKNATLNRRIFNGMWSKGQRLRWRLYWTGDVANITTELALLRLPTSEMRHSPRMLERRKSWFRTLLFNFMS
jgi:hypothetical protein